MPFLPAQPPRCVQLFRIRQVPSDQAGVPTGGSFNSYQLICQGGNSCGYDIWRVYGDWVAEAEEFCDPITVECCACDSRIMLIDRVRDGYDGEIGDGGGERVKGDSRVWTCPRCQSSDGCLIASFGYHFEGFEPHEAEAARVQDYFDSFILTHICRGTSEVVEVLTLECA